ncbi:MAG: DUF3750 domain-containing protein [Pseudomonadota bacterium]
MWKKHLRETRRMTWYLFGILVLLLAGPAIALATGMAKVEKDWRTASRASIGLAPDPASFEPAIIQVYGARTYGWRGAFAVHTWISAKRKGAHHFTTYEVIGWYAWSGRRAVQTHTGKPDRRWFGAEPELYADVRGEEVDEMIDRLEEAVATYRYAEEYRTWPGPNSNTFTAEMGRVLPELNLDLPPTAIGKDFLGEITLANSSPSGTGYQISIFGVLGLMAAKEEGLEVNILGLAFGIDPLDLAIKLPGIGRLSALESSPPN